MTDVASPTTRETSAAALKRRILDRGARIGVIGLGYVGLPLARAFADAGFTVTGFDVDDTKVDQLNSGKSYFRHIADEAVAALVEAGRFRATGDFSETGAMDALLICVPTPLTSHREPDLRFVVSTAK